MEQHERRQRQGGGLSWSFRGMLMAVAVVALLAGRGWAMENDPGDGVSAREMSEVTESPLRPSDLDDDFGEDYYDEVVEISDPLEPLNRGIFWVNDKLYVVLFKPLARVLRVIPEPVRTSASNFFDNLGAPIRFVNSALQGRGEDAGNELARFLLNTTIGIGGLFDPARDPGGIAPKDEDFGQTLGHYGAGQGFYLVLPVLGPSSLRDGVGRVADTFMDPLAYLGEFGLEEGELYGVGAKVLDYEIWLSLDRDTYESIKRESLDPYLFIRNAYAQRRAAKVKQ